MLKQLVMKNEAERNWGAEPWRAPDLAEGDAIMYSECGRIIEAGTHGHGRNGIDYRSHYFRVVSGTNGHGCFLLVKHGAGQERIKLDYNAQRAAQFFEPLGSNERYLLMHMLFSVSREARTVAQAETATTYRKAFIDGRLKKRKARGQSTIKVWIEAPTLGTQGE